MRSCIHKVLEGGRKDVWKDGKPNTVTPRFSSKRSGTKNIYKQSPPLIGTALVFIMAQWW